MQEWSTALNDPGVRAALLSTGLQLMQPAGFGQTSVGHLGMGIGAAGETTNIREKMDTEQEKLGIAKQEALSKQDLRAATANAAEARSGTASERNLRIGEQEKSKTERAKWQNLIRVQGQHQAYMRDMARINQKRTSDIVSPQPALPVDDFHTWLGKNPQLKAILGTIGGLPDEPSPPSDPASEPPVAPPPADRVPNMTYTTPRGPMKWTGTGWISP
jgi:hypothetical protein